MNTQQQKVTNRKASFGATMKTILCSFIGIRKSSDHERDTEQINPVRVLIASIIGALIFIAILIFIVKIVLAH